jgi:hypothetical protein
MMQEGVAHYTLFKTLQSRNSVHLRPVFLLGMVMLIVMLIITIMV